MPSPAQDSPPPSPPKTQSPGVRANALQRNFDEALSHTLRACSYANFAACFPTPAKHVPEALNGLHREFVGKLEQVCKAEFKALMHERNVIPSLNELDGLIADAAKRMQRSNAAASEQDPTIQPPNPPHLLEPSSLLDAHMQSFLTSQTATLTSELETTRQHTTVLTDEITTQRATIEAYIVELENVIADLEGAASVLAGEDMLGVGAELEQAATAPPTT